MEFVTNIKEENSGQENNSDSDEYVDLEEIIKEKDKDKNNIYQIQIFDNELMIKLVGKEFYVPDVIIQENFGPDNKLSLYSCLYDENDFELGREDDSKDPVEEFFHPLIKLVERESNAFSIYSFAVKFKNLILNEKFSDFELYMVHNKKDNDFVYTQLIEKNINSENIIEKILEYYNRIVETWKHIENNQSLSNTDDKLDTNK